MFRRVINNEHLQDMLAEEDEVRNGGAQCFLYAWTAADHLDDDGEYYRNWCKKWGKKWCFQLERGTQEGKLHYQGVISLKVKRRELELKNMLRASGELPVGFRITRMANNTIQSKSETFYVTKPDGREAGPWMDTDEEKFVQETVKRMENNLLPWQQTIFNHRNDFHERIINVIVDKEGSKGKSTFADFMHQRGHAIRLFTSDPERIVASVCDILKAKNERNPKMFIMDMPRSSNQKNPHQVYAAIEMIKGGYAVDTRYAYKEWIFNHPQMWIFCNRLPDNMMLSRDRWVYWEISVDNELVPFDPNAYEVDRHPNPPREEKKIEGEGFLGAPLSLHRNPSW